MNFKTELNLEVLNKEIIISSNDDYSHFGDVLKLCKNKVKDVEDERKEYTKPIDEAKKRLMAKEKEITEPIKAFIEKIETEMGKWFVLEEAKRNEEQKRLEAEAIAKANAEAEALAKETNTPVVLPTDIIVPIIESPKTTRGQVATSTAIKYNEFEVVDASLVPREYLMVDESKIKEAINKGGVESIAGIKIIPKVRFLSR